MTGSYVYSAGAATTGNTPTNPYGSYLQLIYDAVYQDAAPTTRHNLKTGANIPSDIMAEVDRKIDDGLATGGVLRYSTYGGAAAGSGTCYIAASGAWQAATPNSNCGAALLF